MTKFTLGKKSKTRKNIVSTYDSEVVGTLSIKV